MASISLTARFVRENRAFEKSYQIKGHTTTAAGVQQFLSAQKDIPVLLWEICDARMGIVAAGDEVTGPLVALSHSCTQRVIRSADQHGGFYEEFFATPKAETHRQGVRFVQFLPLLMELIDNAITYSAGSLHQLVRIDFEPRGFEDGSGLPEIRVTDHGRGMDKEGALGYFVEGHTTAGAGPQIFRDLGPLKCVDYFSTDLSRYGQGSLAVIKFGDFYELITQEKGSPVVHCVRVDYQEWIKEKKRACVYTMWIDLTTGYESHGFTSITVSSLHKRVVEEFSDPVITSKWLRQVSQDYNFFIDGIPLELWDALPLKLKEGTQRPPGGVNLHFLGTHLHPGQEVERGADGERYTKETPALQRVVAAIKENKTKHPGLKPCVISMRYFPSDVDPPVAPSDSAGPSEPAPPVGGKRGAGGRAPAASKKQRSSGASSSKSLAVADPEPAYVSRQQGLDMYGKRAAPVDMLILFFYCPFEEGDTVGLKQTKPCDEGECELFMLPFWCCRFITNNRVSTQFPRIVDYAKKLASKDPDIKAQGTSFKLDKSRLVGFIFMSPDSDVSTHKTDIADAAFLAFLNAGIDSASSPEIPPRGQLFTYDWGTFDSPGMFKPERVDDPAGPYKSLAAAQLCKTFCTQWHNLDEGGRLVMEYEDGGDGKFDEMVMENGTRLNVCQGTKFTKMSFTNPLEGRRGPWGGEMVKLIHEGQGLEHDIATGRKTRVMQPKAKDHYRLHYFYQLGNDAASVHHAFISQWRPSWGTPRVPIPKSVLCLEPVSAKPGEYRTTAQRSAQATKLNSEFEAKAPRWLCFTSDLASNAAVPNVSSCKYLNANYSVQAEKPSKILVVVACKNALKKLLTVEATSVSQFDFATVVMARLTRQATPAPGAPSTASRSEVVWWERIKPRNSSCIEFLAEWPQGKIQRPGQYTFEFTPDHFELPPSKDGWFDLTAPPLTYRFVVDHAQPANMVARWEVPCVGQELPLVRVGEQPPAIILQLLDEMDRPMACTLSAEQLQQHSNRVVGSVEGINKKYLPSSATCKFVDATHREIHVQLGNFPHMLIAEKASHVDKPLSVELRLGNLPQEGDAASVGGLVLTATLPRKFRLASAPFLGSDFRLVVDSESVFRNTTADNPSEVTKSECVFDTPLAIRLKDRSGNYFYQDTDGVPPDLVMRVEAGLAFCLGAAAQCRTFEYQSDVCQYTIPADTCEMVAVPRTKCNIHASVAGVNLPLVGHVVSRPVILGGEIVSKKGLATGVMLDELDLFEHMNVGKDRAKHDWTVGNVPEAVLKDYKALVEFGGSKVWLSIRGDYYSAPLHASTLRERMPLELVTALNTLRSKAGASCYDFAFTVPVDVAVLPGVKLTFAHQTDNKVLAGFDTTVKVLSGDTNIFSDMKVKDGNVLLKSILVGNMFKEAGRNVQTLKLNVFDADPLKVGQTQAFQYGSLYLRQASYPCSLSLAPVQGGILDNPSGVKVILASKNLKGSLQPKVQASSTADRAARQSLSGTSAAAQAAEPLDFVVQSFPASSSRTSAAPAITIGQLVRLGFKVEAPGPRPTGRQFRLDFLILSQHGVPTEVPDTLREHFEAEAQVVVCQGSADADSATEEHLCRLSGWVWRGDGGARGVQHSSVDVQLPSNLSEEAANLVMRVDIPFGFDPRRIPGQVDCFQLSMPMSVRSFRERVAPDGLTFQAAWQTRNGPSGGKKGVAKQHVPARHSVVTGIYRCLEIALSCTEDSRVGIEVQLHDAAGCAAQDAEFEVVSSTLPALVGQVLDVGGTVRSVGSRLVLQLQLGLGDEWCRDHTIHLKPSDAECADVLPIKLSIKIIPSDRLTHAVSLCQWPAAMLAGAGSSNNPGGIQGKQDEDAVPKLVMGLSDDQAGPGYLPAIKVQLMTASGEKLDAAQLQLMQLQLKFQGEGPESQWMNASTSAKLKPEQDMMFQTSPDQLQVPSKTGTFRVVLQYPGLAPLIVALLTTTAGPAKGLMISPLHRGPPWLASPRVCQSLATTQAQVSIFPQLDILLVDRWNNPATCSSPIELYFTTLLANPTGLPPAAADNHETSIVSNTPPSLIPAGQSAVSIPARPFPSLGILDDSEDTALWLVPRILLTQPHTSTTANPATTASVAAGRSALAASLRWLLLATYHISSSDDSTIRNAISRLEQSIDAENRKLSNAEAGYENARDSLKTADMELNSLQDKARKLGVEHPEVEGEAEAVSARLEVEANALIAQEFHGAAWNLFAGSGGNLPMLEPRPRLPWSSSRALAYKGVASAATGVTAGMGPLMLLGAVERNDVNHALLGILGSKGRGLLTQALAGQQALEGLCPTADILNLSDAKLAQYFRLRPGDEDSQHPQRPLVFQHLRTKFATVLEMDGDGPRGGDGFVGMATNLVHMPRPLQGVCVLVQPPASGGRGGGRNQPNTSAPPLYYSLRQTLWHSLFHETMVFLDKPALDGFRNRCQAAGILLDQKITTLTGHSHNMLGQAWSRGAVAGQALYTGELLMAQVPVADQEAAPLDLRLVRAKVKVERKRAAAQDVRETSNQLVTAGMEVREKQAHHDRHKQSYTKIQDKVQTTLDGLTTQLREEEAKLAKLLSRQPPSVQQNKAAAALARQKGRASSGGAAGTSGQA